MANILSDKERKREENKKRWALRNKESAAQVTEPKGREARVNELRDLILSSTNAKALVSKVMAIALDDEHQGQMAAMKMVIDRIIPVSAFEAAKNEPRTAIQINITGIGDSHGSIDVVDV